MAVLAGKGGGRGGGQRGGGTGPSYGCGAWRPGCQPAVLTRIVAWLAPALAQVASAPWPSAATEVVV